MSIKFFLREDISAALDQGQTRQKHDKRKPDGGFQARRDRYTSHEKDTMMNFFSYVADLWAFAMTRFEEAWSGPGG
jgi:hypothetical protein